MSAVALSMHNVFKKFRRGEIHDSLRDLIPALTKRAISRQRTTSLREEEFWALKDVSFEVMRGEAVGFIGHNGAGKSTLLKLLSGIMKPTRGELKVNGHLSALIEVGAGFHPDLTGRENVFLNGVILGMSRKQVAARFDEIVEFSGLEDFIDTPVKRYSSGMFAKLGFSVAVHLEPEILVVDEVLSVGDHIFQRKSLEKMLSVLRGGSTVIFVSHNLKAVAELCSRAIFLERGSVIQDGPASSVIHAYLNRGNLAQRSIVDKTAYFESAEVRGVDGPKFDFESGEKLWLDVAVRAVHSVRRFTCIPYIITEDGDGVFEVSTEALGDAPYTLQAGEELRMTFEFTLHLPAGSFSICLKLWDVEHGTRIDWIRPAATILLRARTAMRGYVNLYPKLAASKLEAKARPVEV